MDLFEWAELFLRHQDLMRKEIDEIVREGEGLLVHKRSGTEIWLVMRRLESPAPEARGVITLNTKQNLKALFEHWPEFVKHEGQKVVFANPRKNERWVVVPSHHARIADKKSLKQGLEAMFSGVVEV